MAGIRRKAFHKGISLIFVEMIISLFFFSISSVIILNVFAAADGKLKENRRDEYVNLTMHSLCNVFSVTGDLKETTAMVLNMDKNLSVTDSNYFIIPLSSNCTYNGIDDDVIMRFDLSSENGNAGILYNLNITAEYDDKSFSVHCSSYDNDIAVIQEEQSYE